jgi:hypothetical protein
MKIICESKINNVNYTIDVNAKLLIIIILLPRSHIFQFVGNLVYCHFQSSLPTAGSTMNLYRISDTALMLSPLYTLDFFLQAPSLNMDVVWDHWFLYVLWSQSNVLGKSPQHDCQPRL